MVADPKIKKSTHLRRLGPASRLPGEGEQDAFQQLVGLLVVLGDVGVAVQAEHARVRADWESPDIFHIDLRETGSSDEQTTNY